MQRRRLLGSLPFLIAPAQAQEPAVVRIGVLWDRTGIGAVTSGLDQVVAARMAIDDFGQLSRGYPIELIDAGFIRRPDEAIAIAGRWFGRDRVAAILDIPGIAAATQVRDLGRNRNRSVLNTGSLNSALTGRGCSPTGSHWMADAQALCRAMTAGLAARGARAWYLLATEDVTSQELRKSAAAAIAASGGRVLGETQDAFGDVDVSLGIRRAREARADAIGVCAFGNDLRIFIRQARAAGLFDAGGAVCAYAAGIRDIHASDARDLWLVTGFYWDQNDQTRSFARRFNELTGHMPDMSNALTYAAVVHLLRAIEATDTIDGTVLNAALRQRPAYVFGAGVPIRSDGRVMLDLTLYQVRPPERMTGTWDHYEPVRSLPARTVFEPEAAAACASSP